MLPIFYMLEKELIEHKIVTRLPLFLVSVGLFILAAMVLNANGSNNVSFEFNYQGDISESAANLSQGIRSAISVAAGAVSILLSLIYLPKTFRKARQEGSIMFWRSMPVSDVLQYMVKLAFALLVIPLICSLMLLSAELLLWFISLISAQDITAFTGSNSLFLTAVHWLTFIAKMLLVSIAMLPLACLLLAVSQVVNSPLLVVVTGIYTIKILCSVVFGFGIVAAFIERVSSLPMTILFSSRPLHTLLQVGSGCAFFAALLTAIFIMASLSFSKYGKLNIRALFSR